MVDGVKENGPIMTTSFIYLEDVVVRGDNSDFSWQFIEYEAGSTQEKIVYSVVE